MTESADSNVMGIKNRRISKQELASVIQRQVERCIEQDAALGALTIVFSMMDFMSGDGKVSDWIDAFMPLQENHLLTIESEDFWGSRCGLLHSMDVHSKERDKRNRDYRPIMFHQGIDEHTRIFMSSDWNDEDIVVEQGTNILSLTSSCKSIHCRDVEVGKWAGRMSAVCASYSRQGNSEHQQDQTPNGKRQKTRGYKELGYCIG